MVICFSHAAWFSPPIAPFFNRDKSPVHKTLFQIQPDSVLEVVRQRKQQLLHHARTRPLLEAPVRGLAANSICQGSEGVTLRITRLAARHCFAPT